MAIEQSYVEMEHTFEQLQAAVKGIRQCINKIVSIADETNILAINASIEASRAGDDFMERIICSIYNSCALPKLLRRVSNALIQLVCTGLHIMNTGFRLIGKVLDFLRAGLLFPAFLRKNIGNCETRLFSLHNDSCCITSFANAYCLRKNF
mgnify:CR=1 FL=1